MEHLYKNIYKDSNGDLVLVETNLLSGEKKVVNLTKLAKAT
jgi:hypothetical protein